MRVRAARPDEAEQLTLIAVRATRRDGYDAETNDAIRGPGTFARIVEGIRNLAAAGTNPVVTVTEACETAASAAGTPQRHLPPA